MNNSFLKLLSFSLCVLCGYLIIKQLVYLTLRTLRLSLDFSKVL